MTHPQVPPVVCTLTIGKRAERQLEWSDLRDLALSSETIDGGVASTYPLALADKIDDLASRESSCCGSWLQISTDRNGEHVRLEVTTTNPEGVEIIRSISMTPTEPERSLKASTGPAESEGSGT